MSKDAGSVEGVEAGRRCQVDGPDGDKGTVRWAGAVPNAKGRARYYVGVEWDDPARGKGDGETGGVRYFTAGVPGSASFVHPARVLPGRSLVDAVDDKYRAEFEAEDAKRTLVARNGENGRAFEVPVVFVGHREAHEKLRDTSQLSHIVANDAQVESVGDAAALREHFASCTELDLGNNLLASWDVVRALVEALPLPLEELRLSSNVMAPQPAALPPMPMLRRLFLNQVPGALAHAAAFDAAGQLPALEELHCCVCGVETLGDVVRGGGDDGQFPRLRFLNLTGNAISDWAEVEHLRRLPALRRLMLNGNRIPEVRYPADGGFATLEWMSMRDNLVSSWASIDRLNDFPALVEIGFLRNPVAGTRTERDMRIEVLARVGGLRSMNHSEVSRRERTDAEKMYLKRCALEACQAGREEPPPGAHPRFAELVREYGYPAGVREHVPSEASLAGRLVSLTLLHGGKSKEKRVPGTLTVGQLKALVMRLFRVPVPRQELVCGETVLDDSIKRLSHFEVGDGAVIEVRRV